MQGGGRLRIKPLSAQLLKDCDTFGKMDPYVKVQVGADTQKSKVAKDMGKTPNWQDELDFAIAGAQSAYIAMYDHDKLSKDEFIGDITIPLRDIFVRQNVTNTYELKNNGADAGKIQIHFECHY